MFIYNVTTKVSADIAVPWLLWLKQTHIPELIATGCFTHATILHLLEIDDTEGPTYAIQYVAESKGQYNVYIEKYAPIMRQKVFDAWGNKCIAFRSFMQIVD